MTAAANTSTNNHTYTSDASGQRIGNLYFKYDQHNGQTFASAERVDGGIHGPQWREDVQCNGTDERAKETARAMLMKAAKKQRQFFA